MRLDPGWVASRAQRPQLVGALWRPGEGAREVLATRGVALAAASSPAQVAIQLLAPGLA
jgi:hypothetical protein